MCPVCMTRRSVKRHIKGKLGGGQVGKEQMKSSVGGLITSCHDIIIPPSNHYKFLSAHMHTHKIHIQITNEAN